MDNNLKQTLIKFKKANDERYAKPDGYYPTMTVGLADNLTPYSEESGAYQENPFISNGTGTNNNTEIVTVGDYGLLKSKNGNTLVVNQYINPTKLKASGSGTNYSFTSNASTGEITIVVSDTLTDNTKVVILSDNDRTHIPVGHKYFYTISNSNEKIKYRNDWTGANYGQIGVVEQIGDDNVLFAILLLSGLTAGTYIVKPQIIDLTQMFNGNIPQDLLYNPSHFSWYYNGNLAYNTGTLVNANGIKLVSTGRNLFDISKATNNKYVDRGTGTLVNSENHIATDFIPVVPNTKIYLSIIGSSDWSEWGAGYSEPNESSYVAPVTLRVNYQSDDNIIPPNVKYIRVTIPKPYKDVATISLYYTPAQGGEGYDKYYPYEAPYEVDTGSEVLRSAGSVYDYKEPNGTINILVGSYTFTGEETWTSASANRWTCTNIIPLAFIPQSNSVANILTNTKYSSIKADDIATYDLGICIRTCGTIQIRDTTFAQASDIQNYMSGKTIYFELSTPTTEQGTPFAENLPINDYGMLYWLDNSNNLVGIPQGATIFYPTNYKGFVDDMYSRVDGDSSAYVIDTELSASETERDTIDTQLKNAIGGTLRQCLCVKESLDFENTAFVDLGTLSWYYQTADGRSVFQLSSSLADMKADTKK